MEPLTVLSLFDGISCGRVALQRANIPVAKYYASEIDKYAIQATQKNWPDTIQLGDVKNVWARNLPKIDLLIGGSPCQDLSIAKNDREGLKGKRSRLFWHYVRLLRTCKPKWFLLENVASMQKEAKNIITRELGVEPILINSALVSAQQRKRLYWTNIPNITQPTDKGITLSEILKDGEYLYNRYNNAILTEKSAALGTNPQCATSKTGQVIMKDNQFVRKIAPKECEWLQNLPPGYTSGISDTQRYKCIGNGWTVDVIAHIFSFIPKEDK